MTAVDPRAVLAEAREFVLYEIDCSLQGHQTEIVPLRHDFVEFEERAKTLLSRIDAALAGIGWQPVESAPPNTDVLLGWWKTWPERVWRTEVGWARKEDDPDVIYRSGWLHGQATHWLPLPKPPGAGAE